MGMSDLFYATQQHLFFSSDWAQYQEHIITVFHGFCRWWYILSMDSFSLSANATDCFNYSDSMDRIVWGVSMDMAVWGQLRWTGLFGVFYWTGWFETWCLGVFTWLVVFGCFSGLCCFKGGGFFSGQCGFGCFNELGCWVLFVQELGSVWVFKRTVWSVVMQWPGCGLNCFR